MKGQTKTGISKAYINSTLYAGNIEYKAEKAVSSAAWNLSYSLDAIYNPEGVVRKLGTELVHHYYRRDHLDNIREVWQTAYTWGSTTKPASTVQQTQYYPSGLPWAEGTGASMQPHKYNGKEFIETHGLDEYDSEARWYYPAIMRTTTMDPLAEKYYNISPYAWCGNNPVRYIDPDGRDIWIHYTENDELRKLRYTANMKYNGNNDFVLASINHLNAIHTNGGSTVIDFLINSENSFNVLNQIPKENGKTIDAFEFREDIVGGDIYAGLLLRSNISNYAKVESMSHELFHAFQHENKQGGPSIFNEVEANVYGYIIAFNWGKSTSYAGPMSTNGQGNGTKEGDLYQSSFESLTSNGFSKDNFHNAVKYFRSGSSKNTSGKYDTYPLHNYPTHYLLKNFLPKLK